MQVEYVGSADERDFAEVLRLGEQRIERAERVIMWVGVATEHVRMQAQMRRGRDVLKRISGVGGEHKGTDVAVPERPELEGALKIVVPGAALAEHASADRVPLLVADSLREPGVRSI